MMMQSWFERHLGNPAVLTVMLATIVIAVLAAVGTLHVLRRRNAGAGDPEWVKDIFGADAADIRASLHAALIPDAQQVSHLVTLAQKGASLSGLFVLSRERIQADLRDERGRTWSLRGTVVDPESMLSVFLLMRTLGSGQGAVLLQARASSNTAHLQWQVNSMGLNTHLRDVSLAENDISL
jgi:hypothetical protein